MTDSVDIDKTITIDNSFTDKKGLCGLRNPG